MGGHPNNVIMLTCDAFGVLPPIARLTRDRRCTISFPGILPRLPVPRPASPSRRRLSPPASAHRSWPLHPSVYAELLKEKISPHNVNCWLVNTGWSGGGFGVGSRIKIAYSRALVNAAIDGTLAAGDFEREEFFGLMIPQHCPGVPSEVLNPRNVWADKSAYDETARKLSVRFRKNFEQYREYVPEEVARVL